MVRAYATEFWIFVIFFRKFGQVPGIRYRVSNFRSFFFRKFGQDPGIRSRASNFCNFFSENLDRVRAYAHELRIFVIFFRKFGRGLGIPFRVLNFCNFFSKFVPGAGIGYRVLIFLWKFGYSLDLCSGLWIFENFFRRI